MAQMKAFGILKNNLASDGFFTFEVVLRFLPMWPAPNLTRHLHKKDDLRRNERIYVGEILFACSKWV